MKKLLVLLILLLSSCSFLEKQVFTIDDLDRPVVTETLPPTRAAVNRKYYGQDILGLARQNVPMIKTNLEEGQCVGVMAGTFGGTIGPMDDLLSTGKVYCYRFHAFGFCKHGSSCSPGECGVTNYSCMKGKAQAIEALAQKYPMPFAQCYISPYAEYAERSATRVNKWFSILKQYAPSCIPVSSAMGGYVPSGVLIEKHGNSPGVAAITSNDGANYFDSNSTKYNDYAKQISFAWTNRYNLRLTSEKAAPLPPRKRPLSNRISKSDFIQMQLMQHEMPPRPAPPAVCRTIHTLSGGETLKNHSEDYGAAGDSRSNKPLFISRSRSSRMDILSPSGAKIGCFKYYGPYEGLYRLYEGSCSGMTPYELYQKAGGEWAWIKDGSTCIPFPTIRRAGTYR